MRLLVWMTTALCLSTAALAGETVSFSRVVKEEVSRSGDTSCLYYPDLGVRQIRKLFNDPDAVTTCEIADDESVRCNPGWQGRFDRQTRIATFWVNFGGFEPTANKPTVSTPEGTTAAFVLTFKEGDPVGKISVRLVNKEVWNRDVKSGARLATDVEFACQVTHNLQMAYPGGSGAARK